MKRSDIKEFSDNYGYYIHLNEDIELSEAFDRSIKQIDDIDIAQWNRIGLKAYAEGKWSIHKIIQHLSDWERIWCYRTLVFARMEGNIPEALDEELMAQNSNADGVPIEQLLAELRAIRVASKKMFETFNHRILETICRTPNYKMSVLAMGYNMIGHQLHHFNIIQERYVPLDKILP